MWMFTKYGFFSAVCARQGDGNHAQPVDPDRIMVRARDRNHLEHLKSAFPAELGDCSIRETRSTDYRYRLFVGKPAWGQVMTGLADALDYDNFKAEAALYLGSEGAAYEQALHEVWSVMYKYQSKH